MQVNLKEIAQIAGGVLKGDPDKLIKGTASFENAEEEHITYAAGAEFLKKIEKTKAGTVIVPKDFDSEEKNIIQSGNPRTAFAKVLNFFHQKSRQPIGISEKAFIGNWFVSGIDASIYPFVSIGNNVTTGERFTAHPSVVIGNNVKIGDDVEIFPNVTIYDNCIIGNRVTIHAGTVIGSDGFGFSPDQEKYVKIFHAGIVQIDDDVEIGAGCTIDKAVFGKTRICSGVKTDNQVHIAHNVTVGENTLLVAQTTIGGSVTIGRHVIVAGQAGIAQHLTIGDNAIVGPQSGVAKPVPSGEIVSGSTEMPHKTWLKTRKIIPKLPDIIKRLSKLEKRFEDIDNERNL